MCGTQLENQSELRAPTAERAAYYLDAAIAARTVPGMELVFFVTTVITKKKQYHFHGFV